MAKTGVVHHVGTFLLFAATILLLVTTISSPVVHDISLLKVTLANESAPNDHSSITFGTFGYCVRNIAGTNDADACTGRHIGYRPADVISSIDNTNFNIASTDSTHELTRVMVLHPIATGMAFIAFLLALGAGVCGSLLASILAALTWVVTVAVMATDFVLFGIIKNHINDRSKDSSGSHAEFSVAMWTLVAAMICLFFATWIVLFSCFSARLHRRDARTAKPVQDGYAPPVATTRRHFWQRRARY